jgi:hypothetical protein
VAGLFVNAFYLHRYLKVHLPLRPYATMLGAAVASFAVFSNTVLGFFHVSLPVGRTPVLVGVIALGFLVYFGVLLVVGELTREDVSRILSPFGIPPRGIRFLQRLCRRETWPDLDE